MQTCDLIVIGASQGGQALALHAARAGQRVILFERNLQEAATSASQMIEPLLSITSLLRKLPALAQAGVTAEHEIDLPKMLSHIREHAPLAQPMVEHPNLTVIGKEASFAGKNVVTDGKEQYTAPRIVISTGQSPALPEHIQGISETPYLTAWTLLNISQLPARLAVLGAGRTGVTLAQAMAALGVQVHLLDREDRILPALPATLAQPLTQKLIDDGIELHLGASVTSISYRDKRFTLRCTNDVEVITDALLLAIGSQPHTKSLNTRLGTIKLDEQGYVQITPKLETTVPGVYAIGSCTDQPHGQASSWEDAQRLIDLWSGGTRYVGDRPRSCWLRTEPHAGSIGLSADEAELAGYRIARVEQAVHDNAGDGFIELIIDEPSGKLLGATAVADGAIEALSALSLLMALGRTWRDLLENPMTSGTLLHQFQIMIRRQLLDAAR